MTVKFYSGQKDYIPKLNELDQAFQAAMGYLTGSDTTPLPLGTATAGVIAKYAREDHVHSSQGTTQAVGTNNKEYATTEFVQAAFADKVSKAISFGNNVTVTGNLTVNGTTTTVHSTTISVDDPVITLGGDAAPTVDDNKDRGVEFRYHTGTAAKVGFFGFDDSTGKFTFIPDATNVSEVFSGAVGTIVANLEGNVTGTVSGNAGTATKLATARTINGASFDGTANISFSTDAVAEGTTNKYYTDARARAAISATGTGLSYNNTTGVLTLSLSTDAVSEGTTNLYFTAARVRSSVLTGLDLTTNAAIGATDTVLSALGKLQKQTTDLTSTVGTKAASNNSTLTGTTTAQSIDISTMLEIPNWTTATRPANANGRIGYNTDLKAYEGFNDTAWASLGGGAKGAPANPVFYENDGTVTGDYTITAGKNAMSAGPITVNTGVTVTVPSGSVWTIV